MNPRIIICALLYVMPISGYSENLSEIQKIEMRLAELTTIWKQETAIINRLTNFKRTPVQEGTQAYLQCVQASKIIQQAEAEAKILKEKKSSLALSAPQPSNQPIEDATLAAPNSEEYPKTASKMKDFWSASWINEKTRKAGASNKANLSTQEERAVYATKMLAELNPGNYLHPLERISPTLDLLKAEVTLQGKNLKEINGFYSKGDLLGLLGFLKGANMVEYPDVTEIDKLCGKFAEMDFFIKLKPTAPNKFSIKIDSIEANGSEEDEISMLPSVIPVESIKDWFAPLLLGSANNFEVHPDGEQAGYLVKWNPSDGPIILKLPLRPQIFQRVVALDKSYRQGSAGAETVFDERAEVSALREERKKLLSAEKELFSDKVQETEARLSLKNTSLEKKVDIGEMTEDESKQEFIKYKTEEYQQMLQFISAW
jgi:hypothetical protein